MKQQLIELIKKCFGKNPIICDGWLLVDMDNYNKLVEFVNNLSDSDENINRK